MNHNNQQELSTALEVEPLDGRQSSVITLRAESGQLGWALTHDGALVDEGAGWGHTACLSWWSSLGKHLAVRRDASDASAEAMASEWLRRMTEQALGVGRRGLPGNAFVVVDATDLTALQVPIHLVTGRSTAIWLPSVESGQPEGIGPNPALVAVFATPSDRPPLRLRRERRDLEAVVKFVGATITVLDHGATPARLRTAVEDAVGPVLLHVACHGDAGGIELESADGHAEPVSSAALADLLSPFRNRLRLVVLAACESAAVTAGRVNVDDERTTVDVRARAHRSAVRLGAALNENAGTVGPAVQLCQRLSVPVVGMRFEVTDAFAHRFSTYLHGMLLTGVDLEDAFSTAVGEAACADGAVALDSAAPMLLLPGRPPEVPTGGRSRDGEHCRFDLSGLANTSESLEGRHQLVTNALRLLDDGRSVAFWGPPAVGLSALLREVTNVLDSRTHPGRGFSRVLIEDDWTPEENMLGDGLAVITTRVPRALPSRFVLLRVDPLEQGDILLAAWELAGLRAIRTADPVLGDAVLHRSWGYPGLLRVWDSLTLVWSHDDIRRFLEDKTTTPLPPEAVALQHTERRIQEWFRRRIDSLSKRDRIALGILVNLEPADRISEVLEAVAARLGVTCADCEPGGDVRLRVGPGMPCTVGHGTQVVLVDDACSIVVADSEPELAKAVARAAQTLFADRLDGPEDSAGVIDAAWRSMAYARRLDDWRAVSKAVEWLTIRDRTPATRRDVLPFARELEQATRGTARHLVDAGILVTLEFAMSDIGAEQRLRDLIEEAKAQGQWRVASSLIGRLASALRARGLAEEGLLLIADKREATRRAGLGPWSILADDGLELDLLSELREHSAEVLHRLPEVLQRADELPYHSEESENAFPFNVRRSLVGVAVQAARALENWEAALLYSKERVKIKIDYGASDHEIALSRFSLVEMLLLQDPHANAEEAEWILQECGEQFEAASDWFMVGQVLAAAARLDELRGDLTEAERLFRQSLEHSLERPQRADAIAVTHDGLANVLAARASSQRRASGGSRWVEAAAHRCAALLILSATGHTGSTAVFDRLRSEATRLDEHERWSLGDARTIAEVTGYTLADALSASPQALARAEATVQTALHVL